MADIDVRIYQLVIDCADPRSLAAFWMRFTGFEIARAHDDWVSSPLTRRRNADRLPTRPGIQGRQEPSACRLRREG